MNLFPWLSGPAPAERPSIELDPARCLRSIDARSSCDCCVCVCPVGAIRPGNPPQLDSDACTVCRACLPACPTDALRGRDALGLVVECLARSGSGAIELVCSNHPTPSQGLPDTAGVIRIPGCLAGLGAGSYAALATSGPERIVVRADACSACAYAGLAERVRVLAEQAQALLAAMGKAGLLVIAGPGEIAHPVVKTVRNAGAHTLSRRELLTLGAPGSQGGLQQALQEAEACEGKKPGREHERLAFILDPLPKEALDEIALPATPTLAFAIVTVSSGCTACGACAGACPTGALQLEGDESNFRLTFAAQACVGCEACAHVCAEAAIRVERARSAGQVFGDNAPLILSQGAWIECERCGARFAHRSGERLCPVCAFRRSHPFGSAPPPGMR